MKRFLRKLKEQAAALHQGQLLAKARSRLGKAGISIPITADMLLWAFRRQRESGIHHVDIAIGEETVTVSGLTTKLGLQVYFEVEIRPVRAEQRLLYFQIQQMKPLNYSWLKKKLFTKQPEVSYEDGLVIVDLNAWEQVERVPIGTIQEFRIQNGKLWVKIGL
ncbi:hypothetical protein [Ectobacillus ponti]|uniref:Uncharacterized protein n=1 Tax=Ectobacillus ponti TaxID=2961894 RepID=A0AA41X8B7_9BACI|nr:hypothetical protein [Ectobacillus ponti]MCP8970746.1 hypothetical protein [Ectobacillus ponti]